MTTVLVTMGIKREEDPSHHETPRRSTLVITRKEMQVIGMIIRPEWKHSCCLALETSRRSVKYCRITQKKTPLSSHTRKPAPEARKNAVSRWSLIKTPRRRIVWLHLPPQRVEKRARRPKSEPKKSASEDDGALMGFIAWIYRQSMTRTVNPSGSSKNVGKSRWQIKGTLE